jgi:putative sterol carrier protein
MKSPSEFFDLFAQKAAADPAAATAPNAVYQFDLSGDDGGTWCLNLKSGTTSDFVTQGPNEDAGAKISLSAEDWIAMVNGELNPMQAFMSGKIKIDGDMTLAMSLQNVMNLVQD